MAVVALTVTGVCQVCYSTDSYWCLLQVSATDLPGGGLPGVGADRGRCAEGLGGGDAHGEHGQFDRHPTGHGRPHERGAVLPGAVGGHRVVRSTLLHK